MMRQINPPLLAATIGAAVVMTALGGLALYRVASKSEPGDAPAARQALAEGRLDDASQLLVRWLAAAPNTPEPHLFTARLALAAGRLPSAVQEFEQARALGLPQDELALLAALIASKSGRHAEALPVLSQAFAEATAPDRQVDEALAKSYLETYDLKRRDRGPRPLG